MINKLLNWAFTLTPLGKFLDGKKSYIGLASLVISLLLQVAEYMIEHSLGGSFPGLLSVQLSQLISLIEPYFEAIGVTGLAVGVAHKKVKEDLT